MISVAPVILAHHKREDGTYPVRMRITCKRKSRYLATNIVAHDGEVSRTKDSKSAMKIRSQALERKATLLKLQIDDIIADIPFFELSAMDIDAVVERIQTKMQGQDVFRLDFLEYGWRVASTKNKGTKENYETALRSFTEFLGTDSYDINSITSKTLKDYIAHLSKRINNKDGKSITNTGIRLYMSILGAIHHCARKEFNAEDMNEVQIPRNPFEYVELPRAVAGKHRDLSMKQLQQIINRTEDPNLSKMDARALEVFLLGFMLCGMNAVDLYNCDAPKDGVLTYFRIKTRNRKVDRAEMRVRIEPEMLPLMRKYEDPTGARAFNFYLTFSSVKSFERSMNNGLHNMRVPETYYSSRHSWATIAMSKNVKAHKSLVSDALTHSNASTKVTDIYVNKDWEVIWETNRKVLDLFDWSPLKVSTSFHRRIYRKNLCPYRLADGGADSAGK